MTIPTRIESLTGPSREMDAELELLVRGDGWRIQTDCEPFPDEVREGRIQEIRGCGWIEAKAYTASLDAAMTLVDPRALWAHGSMEDGPFARLCWPQPDGSFVGGYVEAFAATVPLAICAAALRARSLT